MDKNKKRSKNMQIQIDVWDDGDDVVKKVAISEEELLRKYPYVCHSSECGALALPRVGVDGECPVCGDRDSVDPVDIWLSDGAFPGDVE
ncbi:MAG: hypothetical protein MJ240_03955 [Kiritimatiellae bacterium]|nr:hypothetical protein [Kiritimatiellia bacterium]